jgi:acyl phosphate:glycerol-3-phosphate acyltransferase
MKFLFLPFAYLFGAIPSGFIIYYLAEGKDIRLFGSRSTGATNVLRLKGWKYAIPVLLFDLLKGFLPVFLSRILFNDLTLTYISVFLVVLGHCFPVYIKFKGGKGVATTLGAFLAISPLSFLIGLAIFVITVLLTKFVSLGSLLATLGIVPASFLFVGGWEILTLSLAVFLVVVLLHLENIRRLLKGEERKIGRKESQP